MTANLEGRLRSMEAETRGLILRHLVRQDLDLGDWDEVEALLTSIAFVDAKCRAGLIYDLVTDYQLATTALDRAGRSRPAVLESWRRFVDSESHVLGQEPELFEQQALNQPADDPVGAAARAHRATLASAGAGAEWSRSYLVLLNKSARAPLAAVQRTLHQHDSIIMGAAMTHDGYTAVSGGLDHAIRVWELSTGRCIGTLRQPFTTAVALDRHGRSALTASNETLILWDLGRWRGTTLPRHHSSVIRDLAMTPDGRLAVSGGDHTVALWDLRTRQRIAVLRGHSEEVLAVAISSDGTLAVSGSGDRMVRVWSLAEERCVAVLEGHEEAVHAVAMTPCGELMISGANDRLVKVWSRAGTLVATLTGHPSAVDSVAVSQDSRSCLSGGEDGEILVWDLESMTCRAVLHSHTIDVSSISLTADSRRALSSGWDGKLVLWNLDGELPDAGSADYPHSVHGLALTADATHIVSADSGGGIHLWDMVRREHVTLLGSHEAEAHAVAVGADGRLAVSAGGDGTVRTWDLARREGGGILGHHDTAVHAVAITPNGRYALSGAEDGSVTLWDLHERRLVRSLQGHTEGVRAVALAADVGLAISGDDDGAIRHWELPQGRCRQVIELPEELRSAGEGVFCLALSPDSRLLAWAGTSRVIWLWDVHGEALVGGLVGHRNMIHAVAFAPGGHHLVSGSADNFLKVWSLSTGRCVASFPTNGNVHACAAGTGGLITCGDSSGIVYMLRLTGDSPDFDRNPLTCTNAQM